MTQRPAPVTAAELSALLQGAPEEERLWVWQPQPGDRPASVLVPLLRDGDALRVLLTRRSPDLSKHAGEYSFPGGRPEPADASPLHTALREAREEVGIPAELIEIVGTLPETSTYKTGYSITPFVGLIEAPPTWVAQVSEVSEFAEPTLTELIASRFVHQMPHSTLGTVEMPVFPLGPDRQVWGATARILDDLLVRLAPIIAVPRSQASPVAKS